MKKWMLLLLALALAVCSNMAMAEGIDLAGLSDEEIVALNVRVQEEIVSRHIAGTAELPGGKYVAGRDLPAGSYVYTCMATGDDWGNVTIYSDKGDGDQLFWEVVSAPKESEKAESFFITLNEDDELKSGVPFSLTVYSGISFK